MYGLETIAKLNAERADDAKAGTEQRSRSRWLEEALTRDWARVGTKERGRTETCGICGCRSNLWVTVGDVMVGIKTVLACPGRARFPELHEKISARQDVLYDDVLPASVQEEIVLELLELRARIAVAGSDVI
jgi:hypothetical protein